MKHDGATTRAFEIGKVLLIVVVVQSLLVVGVP
jgi:hypothetical protein